MLFMGMEESILWGRDLLKKGLKWELGDGSSIDPFCNEWIPFVSNHCGTVSANRWFSSSKVSDLINWESRSWRIPLLSFLFPPEVVRNILAITIPSCSSKDRLVWTGR